MDFSRLEKISTQLVNPMPRERTEVAACGSDAAGSLEFHDGVSRQRPEIAGKNRFGIIAIFKKPFLKDEDIIPQHSQREIA